VASGVKIREEFGAGFGHRDHVAMPQPAAALNINRGLDMEAHARCEDVVRFRMDRWKRVAVNGREANAVAGSVLELFSATTGASDFARGVIDVAAFGAGTNRRQAAARASKTAA
jgi:hypothetical protein